MDTIVDILLSHDGNMIYYPVVKENKEIMEINTISDKDLKKLKSYLKTYQNQTTKYKEYCIKDTYVKQNDTNKTETYYRKKQYQFKIEGFKGIFIIEICVECEKEEIPYIIDYEYEITYTTTKYSKDIFDICFYDIIKKEKPISYFGISMHIDKKDIINNIKSFLIEIENLRERAKIDI